MLSPVYLGYFCTETAMYCPCNDHETAVQLSIGPSASNPQFTLNCKTIKTKCVCRYLGILIHVKFSFQSQIDSLEVKFSRQFGIITKLRHYVPGKQLLECYRSNISSIIYYGILVYGCCSYSTLLPIFTLQKNPETHTSVRN